MFITSLGDQFDFLTDGEKPILKKLISKLYIAPRLCLDAAKQAKANVIDERSPSNPIIRKIDRFFFTCKTDGGFASRVEVVRKLQVCRPSRLKAKMWETSKFMDEN